MILQLNSNRSRNTRSRNTHESLQHHTITVSTLFPPDCHSLDQWERGQMFARARPLARAHLARET